MSRRSSTRPVPPGASAASHFNGIAEEYDRHRPAYPQALLDRACELADVKPGTAVLEIGCGTGQLTRDLLRRGLRVTAVEPGEQLIAQARARLRDAGAVQFVHAPLEDAPLPRSHYRAVFAATSIHWVDPDRSWRRIAEALSEGGTLALVSYFGLHEPWSADDQAAIRAALEAAAPGRAQDWLTYRTLDAALTGAAERRGNVSAVWSWLGGYELARDDASELFGECELTALPVRLEHSARELSSLLATMSFWGRLSSDQREALHGEIRDLHERLGRPVRSSAVACLVAAKRR